MIDNFFHLVMSLERTLEKIEWTIILIIDQIFKVVFNRNSEFIAIIIFTNFKFSFFEFAVKILKGPEFLFLPILGAS